ncbi:MAG: discoidin domain-containing protein, partial [Bacteroidaceae bacterium]|nr:discoidin domain-containing protein [Bacteroidaceae bacterium]
NAVHFHQRIQRELNQNLLVGAEVEASETRGKTFNANKVTDGAFDSYWATSDGVSSASLTFTFREPTALSKVLLQEYIPLGQRVSRFSVEVQKGGEWQAVDAGEETTTIGYKRILRFPETTADALRITFIESRGPLCISEVAAYK